MKHTLSNCCRLSIKFSLLTILVGILQSVDISAQVQSDEFCRSLREIRSLETESFKSITGPKAGEFFSTSAVLPGAFCTIEKTNDKTRFISDFLNWEDSLSHTDLLDEIGWRISDCFAEEMVYSLSETKADSLPLTMLGSYTAEGDGIIEPDMFLELIEDKADTLIRLSMIDNAAVTYYFLQETDYVDTGELGQILDRLIGAFKWSLPEILADKSAPIPDSPYTRRTALNTSPSGADCYYEEGDTVSPRIRCLFSESTSSEQIGTDLKELKQQVLTALGNYYLNRELPPDVNGLPAGIELAYVEDLFLSGTPLISVKAVKGETSQYAVVVDIMTRQP